jgi:hypothetical protein
LRCETIISAHGAPVISPAGVVAGFVSASDVLAWLAGLR